MEKDKIIDLDLSSRIISEVIRKIQKGVYADLLQKFEGKDYTKQFRPFPEIIQINKELQQHINKLSQGEDALSFCINLKKIFELKLIGRSQENILEYWNELTQILKDLLNINLDQKHFDESQIKEEINHKILNDLEGIFLNEIEEKKKKLVDKGVKEQCGGIKFFGRSAIGISSLIPIIALGPVGIIGTIGMNYLMPKLMDKGIQSVGENRFDDHKHKSWSYLKSFILDQIDQQELRQILQNNNYSSYYLDVRQSLKTKFRQYLNKNDFYKMEDIKIKFDKKIVVESFKISWLFARNILEKSLSSKTNYNKSKYQFIKDCLNHKKAASYDGQTFPGLLVGRINANNLIVRLYIGQKYTASAIEKQLNQQDQIFKVIAQLPQEEKAYETQMPYYVFELRILQENANLQKVVSSFKILIPLLKKLKLKAVIFGDITIEGSQEIFMPKHNRHYLKNSSDKQRYAKFQPTLFKQLDRGGFPYFCPGGWLRLSLNVARNQQQFDSKFGNWCVAYHGTGQNLNSLFSILVTGFRSATGCFSQQKTAVYCSPSIQYAAMYAGPYYDDKLGKWVTVVLQLRVNPQKIEKRIQNTISNLFKGDPNFEAKYPKEYGWILNGKTKIRKGESGRYKNGYFDNLYEEDGIVPYGIMIRLTSQQSQYRKK